MIGLDTNVLVRYFAQDDPSQAEMVDFADALIGHCNEAAGCTVTATFDQKALGLSRFRQVADLIRVSSH